MATPSKPTVNAKGLMKNAIMAIERNPRRLITQRIGRLGGLLVQYELLRHGIDSASMTTDTGIDLVAYPPDKKASVTIQVKANLEPKPGGARDLPLSIGG